MTSDATCTVKWDLPSGESLSLAFSCQLPMHQSHGGPRLDSCMQHGTILSTLVRDVVYLYQSSIRDNILRVRGLETRWYTE